MADCKHERLVLDTAAVTDQEPLHNGNCWMAEIKAFFLPLALNVERVARD